MNATGSAPARNPKGGRPFITPEQKLEIGLPRLIQFGNDRLEFDEIVIDHRLFVWEPELPYGAIAYGVDPGQVHWGFAIVSQRHAELFEITMPGYGDAVERIMGITTATQKILGMLESFHCDIAIVEGASFLAPYGQVPLESVRTTAVIALLTAGVIDVRVIPPRQIRKEVFHNASIRAQEHWPEFPENAASALGCALYGYQLATHKETHERKR